MPRGRTPREAAILRRAVSSCIESLEPRQMLTTLIGGDTFDYLDADKNVIRIQLTGDIEAEFIAMRIRETNNTQVVRDLVPAPPDPDDFDTVDGANLFHIYVAAASPDAQIIITKMSDDRETIDPYGGGVGAIQVNDVEGGERIRITPSGGGDVYIGARTVDLDFIDGDDEADLPITYTSRRGDYGVRPGTKGIFAGIETAPGVSLDKILIGGTVTGRVYVGGALGTLYAGDLLLGDTIGLFGSDTASLSNNLFVGGDLRNLLVGGSAGTSSTLDDSFVYRTGLDVRVGGQLGNVRVVDDWLGSVEVVNSPDFSGALKPNTPFTEVEYKLVGDETPGDAFLRGLISDADFANDSADSMFFGHSITSSLTGKQQGIDFQGNIDSERGDGVDYYSLPLIAGQTVTIQLFSLNSLNVGVFDPLGRLIMTDLPDTTGSGLNEPFKFTATLPGVYQLGVTQLGDTTFGGSYVPVIAGEFLEFGSVDYQLVVQEYGGVAIGGAHVGGDSNFVEQEHGITARTGDLGAWQTEGNMLASLFSPVRVLRGNLRYLGATDIGNSSLINLMQPDLIVPRGSVGYVNADRDLFINPSAFAGDDPILQNAVGFDYQRVQAGGNMASHLSANGAIASVIVAGDLAGVFEAPMLFSNADRRGQDGRIDLIDVGGNFGNTLFGGPGLFTGLGGNVKYLRVLGNTFRDRAFGGTLSATQTYPLGKAVTLQDDSGARATLTPTTITDTTTTGGGTTTATTIQGQLEIVGYPVREAAGLVISRIRMGTGITVNAAGNAGQFDIAEIESEFSDATETIWDSELRRVQFDNVVPPGTPTDPNAPPPPASLVPDMPLAMTFNGRIPVNVLSIQAAIQRDNPGLNAITSIANNSSGELVGVRASSIGSIIAQSVGVLHGSTPTHLTVDSNIQIVERVFPFDDLSFGIYSTGPIRQILSREDIGVVYTHGTAGPAAGVIGEIRANADGRNSGSHLEGFVAPIAAELIQRANVGEGLAFGGSGDVIYGGIFVDDFSIATDVDAADVAIEQLVAYNADLRGYIVSSGYFDDIIVRNGSIVNAKIATLTDISEGISYNRTYVISDLEEKAETADGTDPDPNDPDAGDPFAFTPQYGIRALSVTGNGGIIGTSIVVGDFQGISVDGFGILSSNILASGEFNPSGTVTTTGLGIRDSTIDVGGSLNGVNVKGMGELLDVRAYSAAVRQSERARFDAQSGRALTDANDLHRFLGTSRGTSKVSGITNAGILEDTAISGATNLGNVDAYIIRDGDDNLILRSSTSFPMRIFFGNQTGKIKARSAILGLKLVTGRVDLVTAGGNMENTEIDVTGRIGEVVGGRTIRGTVDIRSKGPQGSIGRIFSRQGLYATVESAQSIGLIDVGALGGDPSLGIRSLNKIDTLNVRGDVFTGTYVRASKGIGTLFVGGDVQTGATISAKSYGTTTILGENNGSVIVA